MKRRILLYLQNWLSDLNARKPIIIRGARQVGKTWLIRELAKQSKKKLIEFNFERKPQDQSLFESNDPKIVVRNIEVHLGESINLTEYHFIFR